VIKPPYAEGRQRTPAPPTRSPLARAPEPLTGAPHARATLRATVVQSLQTSAGNRAVSAMVTGRDLAVQRDDEPGAGSGAPLAERYAAALTVGDQTGNYRTAAELLNGFSRADVLSRLAVLTEQQVAYLHIGALENPAVGPGSQVAELTAPGTPRASVPERASSTGPAGAGAGGTPVGEAAIGADAAIAAMSGIDRLAEAFRRSDINAAVRARVLAAMTPEALAAAVVGFAVGFVASQLTPVGWAADVALAFTALFIGTALFRAANHLSGFAAAIEIDALLFLLTRTMGGGSAGAGPASAGSGPVMLATTGGGRLVVIAAETVPVAVSGQVGAIAGAGALAMAGTPRDPDYWEDKYGDDPLNERPRRERISDGNKAELEDSGWLRGRLPDEERRREFMEWLQRRHEQGEAHIHLRPGSREAEQAVGEFELENP
jgi:hypothetical protein